MSGKTANKRDVEPLVISGTSPKPHLKDDPINMNNTHEYVMQYTDIFGTENGSDVVDIQEGDAISDCSDSEVVAHSNEVSNYESHSHSENESEEEYREGPPPLPDSDDESDFLDHQHNDLPGFSGVDVEEDVGEWDYEGTDTVLPVDNYGGSPPPLPTADDSDNSIERSESPVPVSTADSDYGSNAMDELETSEPAASTTEQNAVINLSSTADMCTEYIQQETSASSDDGSQGCNENEEQNASNEKFQEALENYAPEISNNEVSQSSDESEEQKFVSDTIASAHSGQTKQKDSDDEIHDMEKSDSESAHNLVEEIQETSSLIETRINDDSDSNSDESDDQQLQVQEIESDDESLLKIKEQETKIIAVQGLETNNDSDSEKQTEDTIFLTKPQTSVLGLKDDGENKTKVEVKNKSASSKKLAHSDTAYPKKGKMQSKYPGTAVKSSPKDVSTVSSSSSQANKKELSKAFTQKAENLAKPKTGKKNSEVGVKGPTDISTQKTNIVKTTQKNSPNVIDSNWKSKHKTKPPSTVTPLDSGYSDEKIKQIRVKSDRNGTEKVLKEINNETDERPVTKHETGRKRERRSMSSRLAAAVESEQKKGASNTTVKPPTDSKMTAGREQKVKLSGSTSSESVTVVVKSELKGSCTATPDTGNILKAAATSGYNDSKAKEKSSKHVSGEKEKGHFKTKKSSPIVSRPVSAGNTETVQTSNKQTKLNKHSKMAAPDTDTVSMQRHDSEPQLRQKIRNKVLNSDTNEEEKLRPSSVSIAVGTEDDIGDDERDKEIFTQRSNQTLDSSSKIKSYDDKKKAEPYSSHPQNDKSVQRNPAYDKQKKNEHSHHKKTTHHLKHDRKKHVWLCRDDEIHKLIAQKASMLKEYETGSLAGTKAFSGRTSTDILNDISGIPDVGFVTKKPKNARTTRPVSELIPENRLQKKENRRSLQHHYQGTSSEDEDERTNRAASNKNKSPGSTFSVGIASRKFTKESEQDDESDHEETCEYCLAEKAEREAKKRNPAWEGPHHPRNLLLGVVYSCKYLGSTQIMSPQSPNRAVRMQQAQEAMGRIKVPEGEDQPTTDVDVFISTERLKVVNATNKEVMMDHGLRNVSFIADIGDILVLMARRDALNKDKDIEARPSQILASIGTGTAGRETIKITCHVFQSEEAQLLAKSIGQAFNVAYQEFLKKNGLSEDAVEDAEYSGVLEAQKILGEDLSLLADESKAKEVIVNKKPAEMLGVMIVESGWGSMIPTAIIAHLAKDGAAAKSGQLNVGDQILAVNGLSFVGLPLTECQAAIKNTRPGTKVVLKIVSCPPTVQVSVNRPDTKYQLGFSVQNGMICSLMRGSIAERGGVRVGHRIIDINGESVVATSHQRIVELLATTIGEIRMKTMPAAMYRLLVGLDTPTHI